FPIFYNADGEALVDGSLFARNPAGMAVVEAIGLLNWPRESVRLLSIGCTARPMSAMVAKPRGGAGYWGARIAQVFMKAQSSGALMTADLLLGPENVLRVNPELPSDASGIDAVERLPELEALGRSEARRFMRQLGAMF